MFRSRLDNILNTRHPLFKLARKIDWSVFEREFGPLYCESTGRPGLPIRLMVGLHYLKHACNISDEGAVEPIIGHMKTDHRMDRNFLKGTTGDRMNAILAGCGFNLKKLLRGFFALVFGWLLIHWIVESGAPSAQEAAPVAA